MFDELKNISKSNTRNFYLFYGTEDYLKTYFVEHIKKQLIPVEYEQMNFNTFDTNVKNIIDCAQSLPLFNDYRLIIVRNSGLFITGKKNETELFTNAMNKFCSSSIIIFCESKIDKRNKLYKKISDIGLAVEFIPMSEKYIVQWIIKTCKTQLKKISTSNAILLLRTTLGNMYFLKNEIEKLISYTNSNDKNEISAEDIKLLCTQSTEAKIFSLVSAIGNKNLKNALDEYKNLILSKEQPLSILSMIARQFILILQTKLFTDNNLSHAEITQKLSSRNFIISDCSLQTKNFSANVLSNAIKECLEIDYKVKTGQLNDELAIENLIIKYCECISNQTKKL